MFRQYLIARTAAGRPSLMHKVGLIPGKTACGLDVRGWSRAWMDHPIPEILCKKCAKS